MKTLTIKSYTRNRPYRVAQIGSRWSNFVEQVKHVIRVSFLVGIGGAMLYGAFLTGRMAFPVVQTVEAASPLPPVLVRIGEAESKSSHWCTEKLVKASMCGTHELGQVLTHPNTNGTVDVGKYQINVDTWGAKATQLGLNLFVEADNEKMALWIYENVGTGPWASSRARWQ